ncbi:MAG: ATP-binding protein [Acidobacteriota bacterium]|nr:ATP-binding protein [Blastocatellia bacterium]MDW8413749.1 ATP-binding protein [Acidobacteriota bacterium]
MSLFESGEKRSFKIRFGKSLRFKFAIVVMALTTSVLFGNAALLTYSRISDLKQQIQQSAVNFALLTPAAIVASYQKYSNAEASKFREDVASLMRRDKNVDRIVLFDAQGQKLFDSGDESLDKNFKLQPKQASEMKQLSAELTLRETKDHSGETAIEITSPYFDSTGNLVYTINYLVSLRVLRQQTRQAIGQTLSFTLISVLLSVVFATLFASKITHPLKMLKEGAFEIARGQFEHKLRIETGDELEELAQNFNRMAEKLKQNISDLEDSRAKILESNLKLEQTNSRLAKTNKMLEEANENLKELDKMKNEFLQTLSHEVRTPLAAIKGYTEYLQEGTLGPINATQARALEVMQRNVDRLAGYLNTLLDFTSLESGELPITNAPFNIRTVIEQSLLPYKPEMEKKSLELDLQIGIDVSYCIGDRDRILQVLDNLLSNAVKFTPAKGKITVSAKVVEGSKVEIAVSDTGIGISENDLPKIFDRFYQADASTTRKYGGIGIGLSFVKKILDAHKTTIHVESKLGKGTTFRFLLEAPQKSKTAEFKLLPVDRKKYFLIQLIDDEPEINDMLKLSLVKEGYNVIDATTGEEGLEIAKRHLPDIIFLDVRLPDIDGFEVLKRLKENSQTKAIPVIIMSILRDKAKSLEQGAVDHLVKPIDIKQLKSKLNRCLQATQL